MNGRRDRGETIQASEAPRYKHRLRRGHRRVILTCFDRASPRARKMGLSSGFRV